MRGVSTVSTIRSILSAPTDVAHLPPDESICCRARGCSYDSTRCLPVSDASGAANGTRDRPGNPELLRIERGRATDPERTRVAQNPTPKNTPPKVAYGTDRPTADSPSLSPTTVSAVAVRRHNVATSTAVVPVIPSRETDRSVGCATGARCCAGSTWFHRLSLPGAASRCDAHGPQTMAYSPPRTSDRLRQALPERRA